MNLEDMAHTYESELLMKSHNYDLDQYAAHLARILRKEHLIIIAKGEIGVNVGRTGAPQHQNDTSHMIALATAQIINRHNEELITDESLTNLV